MIIINDNTETVTCRICGEQCKRIYGRHLKHAHNNMTTQEYKHLFPNAPITSLKDNRSTSKNSGLHMKTEKYKKMFSEKIRGNKNPMHRSNTTDKFRKEQSPFSVEFYRKRYPDMNEVEITQTISDLANSFTEDRLLPSNKEYWIMRGYSDEESVKLVTKRQTTFSKEICIEKYGEEKGLLIWQERQNMWLSTMDGKTDEEKREINRKKMFSDSGYSKISVGLFNSIYEKLDGDQKKKTYYATKENGEFVRYDKENNRHYKIDFTNSKFKKVIEFNGDFWHCNPKKYNKDYYHEIWKKSANEIWKQDKVKERFIKESMGYELLVIWESEYKKDKQKTIQKCIDFLMA